MLISIKTLLFKIPIPFLTFCLLAIACGRTNSEAVAPVPPADLFGSELIQADGSRVSLAAVSDKDIVAIYFSAYWCPPCRAFTPELVRTANTLRETGKSFELVFISADESEKQMLAYMQAYQMPWPAVPYGSRIANDLAHRFGIRGYPTLIVIDRAGNIVSVNGRGDVATKGAAAFSEWTARSPVLNH